jgi:hypothetical protein
MKKTVSELNEAKRLKHEAEKKLDPELLPAIPTFPAASPNGANVAETISKTVEGFLEDSRSSGT